MVTRATTLPAKQFETKADVEVRVYEGAFPEACEICFASPTAVYVEVRRPEFEALQKTGANGRNETVERRFFCAVHICAADMVYRSY
jgi:hypothetical protein